MTEAIEVYAVVRTTRAHTEFKSFHRSSAKAIERRDHLSKTFPVRAPYGYSVITIKLED